MYVEPNEILEKVDSITYLLNLPTNFQGLQGVFHISSSKEEFWEPSTYDNCSRFVQLQPNLTYEEWLVLIIE